MKKTSSRPTKSGNAAQSLAAARAAAQAGDTDAAHGKYKEAEQLELTLAVVDEHIKFLLANRLAEPAVEVARGYYNTKPADLKGILLYANTLIEAGDAVAAAEVATELLGLDDASAAGFDARGRAYVLAGKVNEGLDDLTQAITLDPKNPTYLLSRGQALHTANRTSDAALDVRSAIQLEESARGQRLLGQILRAQRETQEAVSWLLKATKADPGDAEAWFQLALAQNDLGDNGEAETSAQKATALDRDTARYWYAFGEMLRFNDKSADALAAYKTAAELKPPYPKAFGKYVKMMTASGRSDEAEAWLTPLVAEDPANPDLYFNLGKVYGAQKRYKPAIEAFERYLKLAPESDSLRKEATDDLKTLRKKAR